MLRGTVGPIRLASIEAGGSSSACSSCLDEAADNRLPSTRGVRATSEKRPHVRHIALFVVEGGVASARKAGQWLPGRGRPVTLERVVDALRNGEDRFDHW